MEPMARPASWNRRNRLMNRKEPFGTGTGMFESGSKWNRNRIELERNWPNPDRGHH